MIYRFAAVRQAYTLSAQEWGSFGYDPADLDGDGLPELSSGDVRLDQAFTAHVMSSAPVRILRYGVSWLGPKLSFRLS